MRWREERQRANTTNDAAVVTAMQHAGRAVVFSGSTVAISLLALVALPVPFLRSIGIAGMLIPLVSVAVAVTLLPVVLATIGPRLDRRHTGRDGSRRAAAGRPGRASSCATAGPLRWPPSPSSARSSSRPRRSSSATRARTRWRRRARRARAWTSSRRSGIGTGPLSPFDTLVRSGDPDVVARALAHVDGVRAAVAPADWRRDGTALVAVIPTGDGNSPDGPRDARPRPRRDPRRRAEP